MTSAINPNNIDGSYPVAGQDNNSQGFRDNFTNIKVNFQDAAAEITDLQNKVLLKSALTGSTLNNDLNGALLYGAKIQDFMATAVPLSGTSGSIAINYASGHYQSLSTTGSVTLSFSNWPANGIYGYVKVQINVTNVAHTLTLPAAVTLGTSGLQGYSAGTITFGATGTYEFGFGTYSGGTTITIFDLNRALTNFTTFNPTSVSASGNVTGGNVISNGVISAVSSITGASISVSGNVTGGNLNIISGVVSTSGNVTGGNINGYIRPTAGGGSSAAVLFTSGTNLAAPTAGAVEYDGVVFYVTPTTNRGVVANQSFVLLTSNNTLSDAATAQAVFNVPTSGSIGLAATKTYQFEAIYYITRAAGTTSHTLSTLFSSSSALTAITYTAETTSTTGNTLGAVSRIYGTGVTGVVVTGASTSATENITVALRGIIRTNAATTFIPQIQYSAAPGGAPSVLAGSYFSIVPLGSSSVTYVGNWT